jgi:predicted dehydrogenase
MLSERLKGATIKVGVIGCGKISGIYLENGATFDDVEIVACSDLVLERAEAQAQMYGVPKACSPKELLADEEVEIVLNLTVPVAHAEVSLAALEAGKHVYTEKPLAVSLKDGRRMLEVASERDLRIGCAPDTFLGGGLQTCRKIMDEGIIGEPVAVSAFMLSHGPEDWHPNPDFYFQPGADPETVLRDVGERVSLVHLKDMAPENTRSDLPVGEGTMPWTGLLEAADAAGVEWYVAEQDNPGDALEDVRTSLQHLMELASG